MITVSVVIPAYNASEFVSKAIESIVNQDLKNLYHIEIIVVDDGSTDKTAEALKPLINAGTIRYFFKPNGGASSARNYGIEKAKGEFIGFLDADDIFLPGMLATCLNEFMRNQLDLVTVNCFLTHLDNQGRKIRSELLDYGWIKQTPEVLFLSFMTRGAIGGPHKALFRREIFNKVGVFDTSLKVYEDLDFWIRVARANLRWKHIPVPLLECHRAAGGSLFTFSNELNQDCRVAVLRKYRSAAIALDPRMKPVLGDQLLNFGKNYLLEHKKYGKALFCFWESFLIDYNFKRFLRSACNFLRSI